MQGQVRGKTLTEYWRNIKKYISERKERGRPEYPTGIEFIDGLTDGIHKGEVWCISGKSGGGKSTLAMQIARHLTEGNSAILYISLEMKGEDLILRMFCEMMEVNFSELRRGNYPDNWEKKNEVFTQYIKDINFEIVEFGYTFAEVMKILNTLYTKAHRPDVIFIDFVQLISVMGAKFDERIAIQEFIRELTELAKREKLAIVLVSQLRRPPSGADLHRPPALEDLKGTGSLEQLSHIVVFIYKKIERAPNGTENVRHIIQIAKNRHGATGEKEMDFVGEQYRFRELEMFGVR